MRKLKARLANEEIYTFTTLTLREQAVAKKMEDLPKKEADRLKELTGKTDTGAELTKKEQDEMMTLQDLQVHNMLKIIMMSLAKNHDEFKITEKRSEEDILSVIEDLLDVRDMRRFTTFAVIGTLPVDDEEEIEYDEVIDLTANQDAE